MDFTALRDFVAVVEAGSFAAAARATRTPKSTVSKRVQELEAGLGLRLLERTTRKLRLTPDGAQLFERAQRLVGDAQDLERLMRDRDDTPRGRLRVASPILFGQAFMGHIAAGFVRMWPETTLEVVFVDRRVDLIGEDFDCAIRVGQLDDSSLVARTFAESYSALVAAPDLFDRGELPATLDELARWPAIAFVPNGPAQPWILEKDDMRRELTPSSVLSLGSLYAVREAALAGAGIAYVPEFIATEAIEAGRLLRLLPDWRSPAASLNIVYPSRRHRSARMRAFIAALSAAFPSRDLRLIRRDQGAT